MAWIATVQEVTINGGNVTVVVDFSNTENGEHFIDKVLGDNLTLKRLEEWAINRIASLTSRDESSNTLKSLVGTVLDTTVEPV